MRNYDYAEKWEKLLTPKIVAMLTQIHKNDYRESSLFINKLSKIEVNISERISEVVQINKWQNTNK